MNTAPGRTARATEERAPSSLHAAVSEADLSIREGQVTVWELTRARTTGQARGDHRGMFPSVLEPSPFRPACHPVRLCTRPGSVSHLSLSPFFLFFPYSFNHWAVWSSGCTSGHGPTEGSEEPREQRQEAPEPLGRQGLLLGGARAGRGARGGWEGAQCKHEHNCETGTARGLDAQALESDCLGSSNLWDLG